MQTFLIIVIIILALALWLLFVYHRAYAKEAMRQFRKHGYQKEVDLYIARLEARLDEAQRVGHMEHKKDTPAIYHYNNDGSTVILLEDRQEELRRQIDKGPIGMHIDHPKPISKDINDIEVPDSTGGD